MLGELRGPASLLARLLQSRELCGSVVALPSGLLAALVAADAEVPVLAPERARAEVSRMWSGLPRKDLRALIIALLQRFPEALAGPLDRVGLDAAGFIDLLVHGTPHELEPPADPQELVLIEALNDDYTPMDAVVSLLCKHLLLSPENAVQRMLQVHQQGVAAVARMPMVQAIAVVQRLDADRRGQLLPLRFRLRTDPESVAAYEELKNSRTLTPRWVLAAASTVLALGLYWWWYPRLERLPESMPVSPVVMQPEQRARIEAELLPWQPRWMQTSAAVARIRLEPLTVDQATVSKLGGAVWLPPGESLPKDPEGANMGFLAQINLAEVPEMPGYPRQGLLQFFLSDDPRLNHFAARAERGGDREAGYSRQNYFRVLFWPDLEGVGSWQQQPRKLAFALNPRSGPMRMFYRLDAENITPGDVGFQQATGLDPHALAEKLAAELELPAYLVAQAMPFDAGNGHKLGGYPAFAQDDPRNPGTRLRLLLQLDSSLELMWGDAGVGNFFIDPADLARADFSKVMFNWDSH